MSINKLANISQFEALINTRATVDNGRLSNYLGGKLVKHYLLNGNKAVNPKNFYVAEKKEKLRDGDDGPFLDLLIKRMENGKVS